MFRCIVFVLLFFLGGMGVFAQKGLLWQINHADLEEPSYLFGTIHIIDSADFFWPSKTLESLSKTKELVLELNLEDPMGGLNMMSMMSKMFMKEGVRLPELLSEKDYQYVKTKLSQMGLPAMMFDRIQPLFLQMLLLADLSGMQKEKTRSYEFELAALAKKKQIEFSALETIDDQLSVFDSIPYKAQLEMLLKSLRDTSVASFDVITKAYLDQDLDAMQNITEEELQIYDGFKRIFLENRNENWVEKIPELIAGKPCFIAVGAGHLGGEKGLIKLLSQQGFSLNRIE